jgi:hypothetical protein
MKELFCWCSEVVLAVLLRERHNVNSRRPCFRHVLSGSRCPDELTRAEVKVAGEKSWLAMPRKAKYESRRARQSVHHTRECVPSIVSRIKHGELLIECVKWIRSRPLGGETPYGVPSIGVAAADHRVN